MEAVSHLELNGIFYQCTATATATSQAAITVCASACAHTHLSVEP